MCSTGRLQIGYNFGYTRVMKTAVSIPDPVFEQAEDLAKRLEMSRSEFYATALREFISDRRASDITERLNQIYEEESPDLDSAVVHLQASSLPREEW